MADDSQIADPVFSIQRMYLKEASLEQPNSPAILLEQETPNVEIQLSGSRGDRRRRLRSDGDGHGADQAFR